MHLTIAIDRPPLSRAAVSGHKKLKGEILFQRKHVGRLYIFNVNELCIASAENAAWFSLQFP